jgi:excisionase family DNA binding protein
MRYHESITGAALTIPEVALALNVAEITVRRMIERGELRAFRAGRLWRIQPRELERIKDSEGVPA